MAPKDVSGADDDPIHDKPMPLLEHLMELRRRLLWSLAAFVVAFGFSYYFSRPIYSFLAVMVVSVAVTLFTKPKPLAELKGLVYGVGTIDVKGDVVAGDAAWYRSPALLGTVALALCVVLYLPFL